MLEQIFSDNQSVWVTSFWGWTPETWGTVGFTSESRRDFLVRETTDPFIVVIYVTKKAPKASNEIRGKVVGFYLISHIAGHRDEFTAHFHHKTNVKKWIYSLRALRAFSFLPEYRISIDELDSTISWRARSVAAFGEQLERKQIKSLMQLPYVEVPVYGGSGFLSNEIQFPKPGRHMVRAGPQNRSGYTVAGEPLDTEKELYALRLDGNIVHFLGQASRNRFVFKIGLSVSPRMRLEAFCKSLPKSAFEWTLHRSTRMDGYRPYPSFESAEAGERAMKAHLGKHSDWLGGEFYGATQKVFDNAWQVGREASLDYIKSFGR